MFNEINIIKTESLRNSVVSIKITSKPIVVNENDFLGIILKSSKMVDIEYFSLYLGEYEFDLKYVCEKDETHNYEASFDKIYPEESDFWLWVNEPLKQRLAKILLNNFGEVLVRIYDKDKDIFTDYGKIEIITDKVIKEDIDQLFNFLLSKEVSYWRPFSITHHKKNDEILRKSFFLLVAQLEKDIEIIEKELNEFYSDPLYTLTPKYSVTNFDIKHNIDEYSLYWLSQNLDSLINTNTFSDNTIKIKNRIFEISEIAIQQLNENKDIYENQVIVGFIIDVQQTLQENRLKLSNRINNLQEELENSSGMSLIKIQEKKFYERQSRISERLGKKIDAIKSLMDEYIPVKFPLIEPPYPDNRFNAKEHYRILHNIIQRWYSYKDSVWGIEDIFTGTRTLDSLYELFCLYKIIESIKKMGFDDPTINKNLQEEFQEESYHRGIYNFGKSNNDMFSIKLFYDCLPDDYCTIIPTRNKRELRPDFMIEVYIPNQPKFYLILDAKFKKIKNIRNYTYSELIVKYLHGIGKRDGSSPNFKALFILHPEDKNDNNIAFHKYEYSLRGKKTILPIIDGIEIALNNNKANNLTYILMKIVNNIQEHD